METLNAIVDALIPGAIIIIGGMLWLTRIRLKEAEQKVEEQGNLRMKSKKGKEKSRIFLIREESRLLNITKA